MAMGIITIVHAVLALFLIIELGLTAYRELQCLSLILSQS
jgi:hypothetical protein